MSEFPMPPSPTGTLPEQIGRQYAYLFQMAQMLNVALQQLEGGSSASPGTAALPRGGEDSAALTRQEADREYGALKGLIIKTAGEIEKTRQELTAQLTEQYVARSDFGDYAQEMTAYLEANAQALTQYYSFASDLKANVETVEAAFSTYRVNTQGYVRTGIVHYDGAVPVYGVAVGQNLTVREIDGETVVEPNNFRATFTAAKLSFWQDSTEVAYVSNNRLYINHVTVLDSLNVGNWLITRRAGLAIRYTGT